MPYCSDSRILFSRIVPSLLGTTACMLAFSTFSIGKPGLHSLILAPLLVGIGTFIVYRLGRGLVGSPFLLNSKINRRLFFITLLFATAFLPFYSSATLFHSTPQISMAGLLALAYYNPIHFKNRTIPGLRTLPLIKNAVMALAWALATTPLMGQGTGAFSLFAFRLLFILALGIAIDVRDSEVDHIEGISTLPNLIGERLAITLSSLLLWVAATLYRFLCFEIQGNDWLQLVVPIHTMLTALGVLVLQGERRPMAYFWLVDFQLFLHALLFLILQNCI